MMKKFLSLLLSAVMVGGMLFISPAVASAEPVPPCEHEWGEGVVTAEASCVQEGVMTYTCSLCQDTRTESIPKIAHNPVPVFTKEPTVATRGEAVLQCTACKNYYAKNKSGSELWTPYQTNRFVVKFNCYKPYTFSYKYTLDGAETSLPGTYRTVCASNDLYGSDGVPTHFPSIPSGEVPVGYTVSEFASSKWAVLENGVPGDSFTPGNPADRLYSWMNDTDTNYVIIALYLIDKPEVSISQNGLTLTAEVANFNENLDYNYEWTKDGAVLAGEVSKDLVITAEDRGAEFSVTVQASNAADSVIALANPRSASGSAKLTVPGEFILSFDSNGGDDVAPVVRVPGESFGKLPGAGYIDGLQNLGWYLKNSDGTVSDTKPAAKDLVPGNCALFQKREIKTPSVKISRNRNPYNYTGEPVVLTASFTEYKALNYEIQWFKDGAAIEGADEKVLTLAGNVSDSGTYSVQVTATLAGGVNAVTTNGSAVGSAADKPLTIRRTNNQLLYNPNGGEGGPSNNFDYIKDGQYVAAVQKTVPSREGYIFTGWNTAADGSGDSYQSGDFYVFTDETGNGGQRATLFAQWKAKSYTLRFDTAGGNSLDPISVTCKAPVGPLPTPVRDGYQFLAWLDENGAKVTADTVYERTADSTLTASWAKIYTISFNYNGGVTGIGSMAAVFGEPIGTLPVTSKDGALFAGWYNAEHQLVRAGDIYNAECDITLTAGWADPAASPKTGDNNTAAAWLLLLGFSGAALTFGFRSLRKRREGGAE